MCCSGNDEELEEGNDLIQDGDSTRQAEFSHKSDISEHLGEEVGGWGRRRSARRRRHFARLRRRRSARRRRVPFMKKLKKAISSPPPVSQPAAAAPCPQASDTRNDPGASARCEDVKPCSGLAKGELRCVPKQTGDMHMLP